MPSDNFLNILKAKISELKTDILKFKNQKFLNAAVAGSTLISMADGSIRPEEKQKMLKFIESHGALSVFNAAEVTKSFEDFVTGIQEDKDIGEAMAFESLARIKSNEAASRLIMRLVIAIGACEGNLDDAEKKVAQKIAIELGLNPSEFELS